MNDHILEYIIITISGITVFLVGLLIKKFSNERKKNKETINKLIEKIQKSHRRVQDINITTVAPKTGGFLIIGRDEPETTSGVKFAPLDIITTKNINKWINKFINTHFNIKSKKASSKIVLYFEILRGPKERKKIKSRIKKGIIRFYKTHAFTLYQPFVPKWLAKSQGIKIKNLK